jgi:hypothetical protein
MTANKSKNDSKKGMSITIASDVDRDALLAELYFEGIQWAEVILQPGEKLKLRLFAPLIGDSQVFGLEEVVNALVEARHMLLGS